MKQNLKILNKWMNINIYNYDILYVKIKPYITLKCNFRHHSADQHQSGWHESGKDCDASVSGEKYRWFGAWSGIGRYLDFNRSILIQNEETRKETKDLGDIQK